MPVPVQAAVPLRLQRRRSTRRSATARACTTRCRRSTSARSKATSSRKTRPPRSSTGTYNTPFAYPALRRSSCERPASRRSSATSTTHGKEIANTEFSEKQIQVHVAPGITVDGRIDLIRRLDTGEVAIVDFKSTERAQAEDVTRDQLHVYAVGYQELTGKSADLIEVLNLDEKGKTTREEVEEKLLAEVRDRIRRAGDDLRNNHLPRLKIWSDHCDRCDLVALCRDKP